MKDELLFDDGQYQLVMNDSISEELIELFDNTLWGDEGAVYSHADTKARLEEMSAPLLVELKSGKELIGCCVFIRRSVPGVDEQIDSYIVRYLVANEKYRGKGLMSKYGAVCMKEIQKLATTKTTFIGVVEENNPRSYNLQRTAGYEQSAAVETIAFSRFFPKKQAHISKISTAEEKEEIIKLLADNYKDFVLYQTESLFNNNNYYYIKKDGEILAGLQVHKGFWKVGKLPGWTGKLIMAILPKIPLLRDIFNPKAFKFLTFEGLYYKQGHIEDLHNLIEHTLAINHLKSALFWMDSKSIQCKEILAYGNLGILQKSGASSNSFIMIAYEQFSDEEKRAFMDRPFYQSGFDFI